MSTTIDESQLKAALTTNSADAPAPRKPFRLWPGVVAVVLQWLVWFGIPIVAPDTMMFGMIGGLVCGLAVLVWWLFFSRAPWSERIGAIALMIVAVFATKPLVHPSIANAGMGMMMYIFSIPVMSLALVCWAVATRRFSSGLRRASLVAAILLACGVFTLLRTGGITGDAHSDLHWRWTQTPEERLLAQAADEPAAPTSAPATETSEKPFAAPAPAESPAAASAPTAAATPEKQPVPAAAEKRAIWPGFRGPNRDDVIHGVQIETDWSKSPPVELWRRKIGPGWSSFAVAGNLCYTQEQRGSDEVVSCYNLSTGNPVWRHRDAARFWESNGGAGPRATPTLSNGRVYTFGATGLLNALDAKNGAVVWSRNAASDTGAKTPGWGFASSPLVVNDLVIVAASGRLAAYDAATGNQRWSAAARAGSYSSPQLMTIGGIAQVLLLTGTGVTSVAPADGKLLWEHGWPGTPILQPARTADGDVLITTGDMSGGVGTRRIAIAHGSGGWTVEERWTSPGLKPYFNDFVVHKGHAFGFDGSILACIDLADGARKWKGGRYGHGQLVLLSDQDLLLVLSEEGELALVAATPDQFTELAKLPAIEGKTWNHPVLAGDVLLVRNGEEMAAFRLSLAGH
ncbi:MAG TPA: PQQ-binding-like beta-propeller repeat protein [Blastocatellia bacterium]|nr:PQQ-binding-like beta-propeller repeat protein [Blastocatellia bacterium]